MRPEISAGAIIFRRYKKRREYLLLHYEAGHWDFAKGHLEGHETPQAAAQREIFEETGLRNLKFHSNFKENIRYWLWPYKYGHSRVKPNTDIKQRRVLKVVSFYLAESLGDTIRLSHEHTGYVWLSYKDAVKLATHQSAKELIKKAEHILNHGYPRREQKSGL